MKAATSETPQSSAENRKNICLLGSTLPHVSPSIFVVLRSGDLSRTRVLGIDAVVQATASTVSSTTTTRQTDHLSPASYQTTPA